VLPHTSLSLPRAPTAATSAASACSSPAATDILPQAVPTQGEDRNELPSTSSLRSPTPGRRRAREGCRPHEPEPPPDRPPLLCSVVSRGGRWWFCPKSPPLLLSTRSPSLLSLSTRAPELFSSLQMGTDSFKLASKHLLSHHFIAPSYVKLIPTFTTSFLNIFSPSHISISSKIISLPPYFIFPLSSKGKILFSFIYCVIAHVCRS
jgi:hypothetical protein